MQIAIVKRSDLAREGRWDAGFHIALDEVRERVEQLRTTLSVDQALAKLDGIELVDKKPLMVLARGTKSLNTENMARIEQEYPHLSLALMEKNLEPAIKRIRARIAEEEQALEKLLEVGADLPSAPQA